MIKIIPNIFLITMDGTRDYKQENGEIHKKHQSLTNTLQQKLDERGNQ